MINKFLFLVVKFPKLTIAVVLALTAVFGYGFTKVEFTSSAEKFFIKNDPDRTFFDLVKETFGNDGVTVVAMVAPPGEDIYDTQRLKRLKRVCDELESIKGIKKVVSLTHVERIYGSGMSINVQPLIPEIPDEPEEWAALKNALAENHMYDRNLVSPDRRTAAINIFMDDFDDRQGRYSEILDEVSAVLNSQAGPDSFYVSGIHATKQETLRAIKRDLGRFMPLTFVLIVIILAVSFRTFRGVLLPLASVCLASVWTVGFMGLAGISLSMVTVVLPPLIVAIGNAYTIHVMSEYVEQSVEASDPSDLVYSILNRVSLPLVVCGFTTVIGFGSLGFNKIPAIRDLGVSSAVGVVFCVFMSLVFVPAVLALMPSLRTGAEKEEEEKDGAEKQGLLDEFLASAAEFSLRNRVMILAACMVLALAGALGGFRIDVDTDFLSFFDKDDPVTVSNEMQTKYLAGAAPFFVIMDGKGPDVFKDPALLRKMDLFHNWLTQEVEGIDLAVSLVDFIKILNKVFHKNDPAFFKVPDDGRMVAQLLLFYSFSGDPADFAPYVNGDYSQVNVMVRSRLVGSKETDAAIREIEAYANKLFGDKVDVKVTGTIKMMNKSANEVALGQIKGIATCLIVIFLVMSVLFISPRVGFLAMLPNVLPVLVLFGVMGFAGVTLNFSTSLIACIAIGLGVDDTIHLMSRYNSELKEAIDPDEAIRRTIKSLGKPVIYTSLSLFFGFSIIAGSDFVPIRHFGALTGMSILVCLLADLFLLPALISTVRITTLWDHVDLGIGGQVKGEIRLFKGLSPHQAKMATLMGVFGFYADDERIVQEGEVVKDLFVVLEGGVKSHNGDMAKESRVGEGMEFGCAPGRDPYSSDVNWVAVGETKVLMINPMTLDRLKGAHPKIAERIEANLARIS